MKVAKKSPSPPRVRADEPAPVPNVLGLSGSFLSDSAGFSVWSFEKGSWRMVEDRSGKGYVPGSAPKGKGQFDGYCVKVTSVRPRRKGK